MTNQEKLYIRCLISNSVHIPPDEIRVIDGSPEGTPTLFALDNYRGFNLVIGFSEIPAMAEVRATIKDLYLHAVEWEDEEDVI